jgi:hypothetical protein
MSLLRRTNHLNISPNNHTPSILEFLSASSNLWNYKSQRSENMRKDIQTEKLPLSSNACISLACGLIALAGGGCIVIPSFIGFAFGHKSLGDIKEGRARGKALALAGLTASYLSLAWIPGIMIYFAKHPLQLG